MEKEIFCEEAEKLSRELSVFLHDHFCNKEHFKLEETNRFLLASTAFMELLARIIVENKLDFDEYKGVVINILNNFYYFYKKKPPNGT